MNIAGYAYLASYSRFPIPNPLYGCSNRAFLRFPLYLQASAGTWAYLRLNHDSCLTHPSQFIDHCMIRLFVFYGSDSVVKLTINTIYIYIYIYIYGISVGLLHF